MLLYFTWKGTRVWLDTFILRDAGDTTTFLFYSAMGGSPVLRSCLISFAFEFADGEGLRRRQQQAWPWRCRQHWRKGERAFTYPKGE
jgi:hypothetical protein